MVGITPKEEDLIPAFKKVVFDLLLKEGLISNAVIENMNSWIHDGFHVYCGKPTYPWDDKGLERLGQYIVRAPLSQERMTYIPKEQSKDSIAKVIYKGKTSKKTKVFYAIDWLARLTIHIPNKGEQMVKYYGYYSNKSRGLRKKEEQRFKEGKTETIQYSNIIRKKFNKKWARLIQKVYNVDPLICPKCSGKMRIISFIEEEPLIKKILKHLKLWIVHNDDSLNKSPPQKILDIINNNPIESPSRYNSVGTHTNTTLFNSQEFVAVMQMPYEDEYSQLVPYDD